MISQAHDLFRRDAARMTRREELYAAITEHIMSNLPDTDGRELGSNERPVKMILDSLPRIRTVADIPSLEMFLSFLESLPGEVNFFDLHNFIELAGDKSLSTFVSGQFLYKSYLTIGGFAGEFDVRQAALGLRAYAYLQDLLSQDGSEESSFALIKAARELGDYKAGMFTTASTLLYDSGNVRTGYYLRDTGLVKFIAANPERVDDIISTLISRGDFPGAEILSEMIDSDSKPLSTGLL